MRAVLLAALISVGSAGLALAGDPTGTWTMESGKVTVKVSSCGSSLCGTIVGLKKPLDKRGKPKVDKENPNPSLRSRPLIGLALLRGMKPKGENAWQGQIYNPDDGRTYSAYMSLNGSVMKVKGCVVVICKTQRFVRIN